MSRPELTRLPMLTEVVAEAQTPAAPANTAARATEAASAATPPAEARPDDSALRPWALPPPPGAPLAPRAGPPLLAAALPVLTESLDALLAPLSEGPLASNWMPTAVGAAADAPVASAAEPAVVGGIDVGDGASSEPTFPAAAMQATSWPQAEELPSQPAAEPSLQHADAWPLRPLPLVDELPPSQSEDLPQPSIAEPAAPARAPRHLVDDAALVDAVVGALQPRVDALLDDRLRAQLVPGLAQAVLEAARPAIESALQAALSDAVASVVAQWLPDARRQVMDTLREVVTQAVADEAARSSDG